MLELKNKLITEYSSSERGGERLSEGGVAAQKGLGIAIPQSGVCEVGD